MVNSNLAWATGLFELGLFRCCMLGFVRLPDVVKTLSDVRSLVGAFDVRSLVGAL